jgi:hypothetical protein
MSGMIRISNIVLLTSAAFLLTVSQSAGFELNGFADVSFEKCTQEDCKTVLGDRGGRNGNFTLGSLDFFAVNQFDQVDVLLEMTVEEGHAVDLERLYLGYTFSDALRLRVGRFHTPLGFWNPTYHHGVQMQPTIRRPQFLMFEDDGGILPMHTVGIYLSGRMKNAMLGIDYGAMVGNGPGITVNDGTVLLLPNDISDNSPGKSVAGQFAISPAWVPGLNVGVAEHFSRVQSDQSVKDLGKPSVDVDQTILAAALTYGRGSLDLKGEYFSIRDKDKLSGGSGTHTSHAYYGLLSYTLADRWVPYLMYEAMSVKSAAGEDPYFIVLDASDVIKAIGGIRYNLTPKSSIRGEARRVKWGNFDWNEYAVQWAIGF